MSDAAYVLAADSSVDGSSTLLDSPVGLAGSLGSWHAANDMLHATITRRVMALQVVRLV